MDQLGPQQPLARDGREEVQAAETGPICPETFGTGPLGSERKALSRPRKALRQRARATVARLLHVCDREGLSRLPARPTKHGARHLHWPLG
jgi:hypothetical protein